MVHPRVVFPTDTTSCCEFVAHMLEFGSEEGHAVLVRLFRTCLGIVPLAAAACFFVLVLCVCASLVLAALLAVAAAAAASEES